MTYMCDNLVTEDPESTMKCSVDYTRDELPNLTETMCDLIWDCPACSRKHREEK